jgi:2-keto-4-pentenoate hydratase/2-oxohepta-3-ene-1,7-dioic acid hydratase in catechol pathway
MQLLTIDDIPGGSPGARLRSGDVLHLARAARRGSIEAWLPAQLADLLAGGPEAMAIARRIVDRAEAGDSGDELAEAGALLPADTRLLAPLPSPRLIVAAGLAFRSHLAEMANTPAPAEPTAFMKSPRSIAAPGAKLRLPAQASGMVDYEGELACVFGQTCYMVSEADALGCIGGYTIANDISARDWAPAVWAATAPWHARQTWEVNIMGKQLPGFTPLGPVLLTADDVPDPAALHLTTRLNGAVMQDASIADLIFPLARTIAYLSRWYRFEPGDLLLTGTPAGVGIGRTPPVFLQAGDTIEVEIGGIGTLTTPILPPVGAADVAGGVRP